ncbi:MAG TPA: hypothetical protein VHY56_06300, partial [Candidatus Binataceae bacterium]|nr:hypothetical protein [Candidatus Binataceae bacterium]
RHSMACSVELPEMSALATLGDGMAAFFAADESDSGKLRIIFRIASSAGLFRCRDVASAAHVRKISNVQVTAASAYKDNLRLSGLGRVPAVSS